MSSTSNILSNSIENTGGVYIFNTGGLGTRGGKTRLVRYLREPLYLLLVTGGELLYRSTSKTLRDKRIAIS